MEKQHEIIKAIAYGYTNEEIAAAEDATIEEVALIRSTHTDEIETVKAELKKGGYAE